jgi:hypothetical protein
MLEELAHERCHEGNPFFALSCRCENFQSLFILFVSDHAARACALLHLSIYRESGVVVASPMLRPQGASQLGRRRLTGDSAADINPHELLRVSIRPPAINQWALRPHVTAQELAERDSREKELLLRIDSERARADAAEWRLKLIETRQESSARSASSGDGQDVDSSAGTMSSADLIDSPWQTSSSLAYITISDMWSEVVLAAIEDNAGWQSERDNGAITSHTRTFSWSSIPCRKGRITVRASHDVVADVLQQIGTPLKQLTKHSGAFSSTMRSWFYPS